MLYNEIGKTYNRTRAADERIIAELVRLLDLEKGAVIADIGAGTGNYSYALAEAGYRIKAIEPSAAMISRSRDNPDMEWCAGCAENIPLRTGSVDAAVAILAIHHFPDMEGSFREMARILKGGPVVIFTFDVETGKRTWMYYYFPFFWDKFSHFPGVTETAGLLEKTANLSVRAVPFELPPDLRDNFTAAAWKIPHLYLDRDYRKNISSFRMTDRDIVEESVQRLKADLESGRWEQLYGHVLQLDSYDAGYYFVAGR